MAPNLSGLMSGQKLSASNCPSTNCFRVNVSFANFLHSQYPPFANSSIGCKTKPFIYSETKSRLLERKEVTQGHEMRWLKSSVSCQKTLQHLKCSLRNWLNAAHWQVAGSHHLQHNTQYVTLFLINMAYLKMRMAGRTIGQASWSYVFEEEGGC